MSSSAASRFAFLKKKPAHGPLPQGQVLFPVQDEPDTNVISITFNSLKKHEENIQMGDAHFCKGCRSCLTSVSLLYTKDEYLAKYPSGNTAVDNKEEEKEEEKKMEVEFPPPVQKDNAVLSAIGDDERVWVCEFCGIHNLLAIEPEEVPKTDNVTFLLQSAQQINKNASDMHSDITTVFCIDNSGSMSVTSEVKGKHDLKHGLSPEEYEMLKQFIEYGADQHLPNQKKDTTFISRKQCVLAAIEEQLVSLKGEFPNRKVGLVTFNNEVCVIGDGKNVPENVTGDKLYKYDVLRQIGEGLGDKLIAATVKDSAEDLLKKFEQLKETGKTALGPALLISLGLALKGKQGSRVILCTDGLANVGLGEMDTAEGLSTAENFYTDLATLAKENGISISVISIKGEGCKLDILGKVADITSGSLTRVDPNEITGKFATIMKHDVVGTQVDVKLRLFRGMKFRNEASEMLKEGDSLFEKNVGNVTAQTELTFEYEMKSDEELSALGIDSNKMKTMPFQAQIIYTSTSGDRLMRVITRTLKTTHNLEEAEKELDVKLLAARALQQQADFAARGMYSASNQVGEAWGDYFNNKIAVKADNVDHHHVVGKYQARNKQIQEVATKKNMKKEAEAKPKGIFENLKEKIQMRATALSGKVDSKPMQYNAGGMNEGMYGSVMKKGEKTAENDNEEDDNDYELVHAAKNCNSDF